MKITKRQLRRIIKEEKAKILTEEIGMSEEDTIQEVFHKHFAMAEEEIINMGIPMDQMGMLDHYIKMSINSYRGA